MAWLVRHVNPGLVVGFVALGVALGGGAFAGGARSAATSTAPKLVYKSATGQVGPDTTNGVPVLCGRGTHVTGGGVRTPGANSDVFVAASQPVDTGDVGGAPDDGWYGFVDNEGDSTADFEVYAICARGVGVAP
ncbi:MAG: hypothetical protein M3134_01245 [Actinomycetota bacterium]|nr:hypothetical protein [Actinomycetota bacterium]